MTTATELVTAFLPIVSETFSSMPPRYCRYSALGNCQQKTVNKLIDWLVGWLVGRLND